MRRIKTALYLDAAQIAALKAIAKVTRVPLSIYIREGIDLVIAKYRKHLKPR